MQKLAGNVQAAPSVSEICSVATPDMVFHGVIH
jgi:hypothetical protein